MSTERTNHGKQASYASVPTAIGQEENSQKQKNQLCIQLRSVYLRQWHWHHSVLETKMDCYSEQRYKQTSTHYRWGWDEFPMWALCCLEPGPRTCKGCEIGFKILYWGKVLDLWWGTDWFSASYPINQYFPELPKYPFDKNYSNHR